MSLVWLSTDAKTKEAIELGNKFDDETFEKLIHYIYQHCEPKHKLTLKVDKDIKMTDFEKLTGLNNHQFTFVMRTYTHILRSALKFLMKPSDLKIDLTDKLNVQEEKALAFVQLWIMATKHILDDIQTNDGTAGGELNVEWNLQAGISSDAAQKQKDALGQLKLQTKEGKLIDCVFNHQELSEFYKELENIQKVLDGLKT